MNSNRNIQKQPPEVFCKKCVLRNFEKFAGKQPLPESLFNKNKIKTKR